ncbi:MAG: hypothetical protein AAB425_02425 [Bdellovibrionota bacterium]
MKIGLCTGSATTVCFGVETGSQAPRTLDGQVYEQAVDCAQYPFSDFTPSAWPALKSRLASEDSAEQGELERILGNLKRVCERTFPGVRCLGGVRKGTGCVNHNPGVLRAYNSCVSAVAARVVAAQPAAVAPEVAAVHVIQSASAEVRSVTGGAVQVAGPPPVQPPPGVLPITLATVPTSSADSVPPCPDGAVTAHDSPTLETEIPSCDIIGKIREPDPEGNAACGRLDRGTYNKLIFLSLQGLKALNLKRAHVASRLSCLLGVRISPEMVTDALAKVSRDICSADEFPNHRVGCTYDSGESAAWSGDSFTAGSEKGPQGGSLLLNPTDFERENTTNGKSYQANFVNSVVHEEAHLLATYFNTRIPNASFNPGAAGLCASVGQLPGYANFTCDPASPTDKFATPPNGVNFNDAHDRARFPGNPECLAAYNKSVGLPPETPLLGGMVNRVDWESLCTPSGLYRNEATARKIAASVVDSAACRETYPLFFKYGRLRSN